MCGDILKFKLVEKFKPAIDTLNEELGVRFYLGQSGSKIGGLFTATGKLLKQLWDEDDEHYDDINYHLSQLEDLFDVPDLDYKNNNYNFAFKKSFITDEVREIINNLNFYLNEIDYEIIEETVDAPNIEYQDDNQFAYKSLDEEVLNEKISSTSIIDILLSIASLYIKDNSITKCNSSDLVIHHINGDKKCNDITNLCIMKITDHEELHTLAKRRNRGKFISIKTKYYKEDIINNLNKYPHLKINDIITTLQIALSTYEERELATV